MINLHSLLRDRRKGLSAYCKFNSMPAPIRSPRHRNCHIENVQHIKGIPLKKYFIDVQKRFSIVAVGLRGNS